MRDIDNSILPKLIVCFYLSLMLLAGCRISDKDAEVLMVKHIDVKPKDFVLVGDRNYQAEFTASLAKYGFNLKPISIRYSSTELKSPTKIIEYEEIGTRYAIDLVVRHNYLSQDCVFSDNHGVDVIMSIIDILENETVLIIKQNGPDGECPPLTPVWDLLAAELAKVWGVKEKYISDSLTSPKH